MVLRVYFIRYKKGERILKKYKIGETFEELTINKKDYLPIECDLDVASNKPYLPDYIGNQECFDELINASETHLDIYLN